MVTGVLAGKLAGTSVDMLVDTLAGMAAGRVAGSVADSVAGRDVAGNEIQAEAYCTAVATTAVGVAAQAGYFESNNVANSTRFDS